MTPRWIALAVVGFAHVVLSILLGNRPTGETLGMASAFAFWGAFIGGVVWLVRGRKPGTFAGPFYWVAMVLATLGLINSLMRL